MNVYLVTGQIATGKSHFKSIISKKGYKFFCADSFVSELYKDKNIIENIKNINKEFVIGSSINKDKIRNNIYENSKIRIDTLWYTCKRFCRCLYIFFSLKRCIN